MVNTNIQGVVPIEGPGLTFRPDGNYQRGEYSIMKNVEIVDGALRTRRPIIPVNDSAFGTAKAYVTSAVGAEAAYPPFLFSGEHKGKAFIASYEKIGFVGGRGRWFENDFDVKSLPGYNLADPGNLSNSHTVQSCFFYNNVSYFLTKKRTGIIVPEWYLYYRNGEPGVGISTVPASSVKLPYAGDVFIKTFMHKDRVFVVFWKRILFSKATDPTVWSTPDGGFIGLESGEISDVVALGDTIYIATNQGVYAYTFSTDPNQDGYLRLIFSNESVTSLCILDDTVYAASQTGLYRIYGSNFDKIKDFTTTFPRKSGFSTWQSTIRKIEAFGDSLIMGSDAGTYMFNLQNGCVSEIIFQDATDLTESANTKRGVIVDFAVPLPVETQRAIYFAVEHRESGNYRYRFYFMNESRNDVGDLTTADQESLVDPYSQSGCDRIKNSVSSGQAVRKVPIPVQFKLENWTPDGSEFLMKKMRAVLMEGTLPKLDATMQSTMKMYVDSDEIPNQSKSFDVSTSFDKVGENRARPFPYRFWLNQRTKTLSIEYSNSWASSAPPTVPVYDKDSKLFLLISKIKVLWSYLGTYGDNSTP